MAAQSSVLAWRILGMGEPGGLPSMGCSESDTTEATQQQQQQQLVAQLVKKSTCHEEFRETWVWSLGWEDPLEKGKTTYSSVLAWGIPWTVESMGSQTV